MAGRGDRRAHLHNARAQSTHPSNVTSETFPRGNNSRFESFPLFFFPFSLFSGRFFGFLVSSSSSRSRLPFHFRAIYIFFGRAFSVFAFVLSFDFCRALLRLCSCIGVFFFRGKYVCWVIDYEWLCVGELKIDEEMKRRFVRGFFFRAMGKYFEVYSGNVIHLSCNFDSKWYINVNNTFSYISYNINFGIAYFYIYMFLYSYNSQMVLIIFNSLIFFSSKHQILSIWNRFLKNIIW